MTGLSACGKWLHAAVYEIWALEKVTRLDYIARQQHAIWPGIYDEKQNIYNCNLAQPPRPWTLGYAGCTFPLLPGGSMDAARLAWDTPASRSSYLPSPYLLSPLAAPSALCLPLPFAVVLLCCWFCFVLLLLCLPGLGSCVLSPPSLPPFSFLRSACFLCAPLPVLCLCGFTLVSLLFCCGWLSLFRSYFPLPACACVWKRFDFDLLPCRFPRYKIFLQFLVRRDSCVLTTGIKEHVVKSVRSYHPRIDATEIFHFLPWRCMKRHEEVHSWHFAIVCRALLCVKPSRYHAGKNHLRAVFRHHLEVRRGAGYRLSMQEPAQRRSLHVTLISSETPGDVPALNVFRTVDNVLISGSWRWRYIIFCQSAASGWLLRNPQGDDNIITSNFQFRFIMQSVTF